MIFIQDVQYGVTERVRAVRRVLTRMAPGPLLVRAGVLFAGAAALVTAFPNELVFGPGAGIMVVLAALPAVWARARFGTLLALVAVLGWLMSTTLYGDPVTPWRLIALASLMYLAHTLTALAAVLPYDAVVSPEAVGGWLGRALAVIAVSGVLSMGIFVITGRAGGQSFLAASLAGLALAVGLAALLPRLGRRGEAS
jgi:hypothetical protein